MSTNPPGFNIGCAVAHTDSTGMIVPCPGYPLCAATGAPVEPSPPPAGPQPECTSCHGFGAVLQDAIDDLTKEAEWGKSHLGDSFSESLSIVLTALARHHE